MRKINYIVTIFLFINQLSNAQTVNNWFDVEIGALQKQSKKNRLHSIIGADETNLYTLSEYAKGSSSFIRYDYILEQYNEGLVLTTSLKLDLKYLKEKMTFEHIVYLNNHLSLFTSLKHHNNKKNYLFVQTVDKIH